MAEDSGWTGLEPGQLKAMRVAAAIGALVGLSLLATADLALHAFQKTPLGLVSVPAIMLAAYLAGVAPFRRYRAWGYKLGDDELHVRHGVLTNVETAVAFHRVQHIDVSQGPIERLFGVCRLVLNTAGTVNSRVSLPGLKRETAEAMRDTIRAHIRQDAA